MIARSNAMISRAEAPRWTSSAGVAASPSGAARQVLGAGEKHLALALLGVEPDERQMRELGLETVAAAPDLADERALGGQMRAAPRRGSAARCPARRARRHARAAARRRIRAERRRATRRRHRADWRGSDRSAWRRAGRTDRPDEARCASTRPCSSTLRRATSSASAEMSTASIRALGNDSRGENRERAAAGAEIEHALDRIGVLDQRALADEAAEQQFADEAARHDHALVDIERHALDIGAIEKVGGGLARRDARVDQLQRGARARRRQRGVEKRIERVDRQAQRLRGR